MHAMECSMAYSWLYTSCHIFLDRMKNVDNDDDNGTTLFIITLKEETFAVQENREIFTFRGNKLSRMTSYEKFRRKKLSRWTTFKIFHGNKKRRKSKFMRRNIRFYCTVLRWDTWPVLKSLKKDFQKTCFPLSLFLEFLMFWNFTNATIIWYYNYKSVFFFRIFADDEFFRKFRWKKLSRMTSFEKFRENKRLRIWLKTAKPRKFLPAKVSSFKVSKMVVFISSVK